MFFVITEAGPTFWRVELVDSAWNVYESILTQDAKKTKQELIEQYQLNDKEEIK